VIDQLIVSGATSGAPTSTWRFSRDPNGTQRLIPLIEEVSERERPLLG
jgi:hypothetical protein